MFGCNRGEKLRLTNVFQILTFARVFVHASFCVSSAFFAHEINETIIFHLIFATRAFDLFGLHLGLE